VDGEPRQARGCAAWREPIQPRSDEQGSSDQENRRRDVKETDRQWTGRRSECEHYGKRDLYGREALLLMADQNDNGRLRGPPVTASLDLDFRPALNLLLSAVGNLDSGVAAKEP
jgi:hypothetical protein